MYEIVDELFKFILIPFKNTEYTLGVLFYFKTFISYYKNLLCYQINH